MSGVAGHLAGALAFLALGVAVALPQRASATHTTVISYVQRGIVDAATCSNFRDDPAYDHLWIPNSHPCWHKDEPEGTFTAIDYPKPAGTSVFFIYLGDFQHFKLFDTPPTSGCHGVEARLYEDFVGNESFRRGNLHYLHLDPAGGVIGKIPLAFQFLGSLRSSEPNPCTTTGPHLHQSADDLAAGMNPFYFNRYGNPDGDKYQEHTIYWPTLQSDADGDSYGDNHELRMSTDPLDDCPDSSTPNNERGFNYFEPISPWPPDFNDDRTVDIFDVNALRPPVFFSSTGDPYYSPRLDIAGPGGITDGVIDIFDVNHLRPPLFFSTCTP